MFVFEDCFRAAAAVSLVFSSSVVFTGLLCPRMMLSSTRPFSHIIFFISISDVVSSAASIVGFPSNGTISCYCQGFFFTLSLLASWFWTAILVYQLRCVLIEKRLWLSLRSAHGLCWTSALLCTLLPLSTNEYGNDDAYENETPCTTGGDPFTNFVWIVSVFFGPVFVCFLLMCYWMYEVARCFQPHGIKAYKREYAIYKSTRLYPLGLLVSWVPVAVLFMVRSAVSTADTFTSTNRLLLEVCLTMQTQYGTVLAIIFFMSSPGARMFWWNVFSRKSSRSRTDSVVNVAVSSDAAGGPRASRTVDNVAPSWLRSTVWQVDPGGDEDSDREDVIIDSDSESNHIDISSRSSIAGKYDEATQRNVVSAQALADPTTGRNTSAEDSLEAGRAGYTARGSDSVGTGRGKHGQSVAKDRNATSSQATARGSFNIEHPSTAARASSFRVSGLTDMLFGDIGRRGDRGGEGVEQNAKETRDRSIDDVDTDQAKSGGSICVVINPLNERAASNAGYSAPSAAHADCDKRDPSLVADSSRISCS